MALKKTFENIELTSDKGNDKEPLRYIKIAVIDPDPNNNKIYDNDETAMQSLMSEIDSVGLIQPITVKRNPKLSERYIIISGKKYRA
jgi:ParB-like chromosome segregation protein Spo0J